jgi:hypothetical protein
MKKLQEFTSRCDAILILAMTNPEQVAKITLSVMFFSIHIHL